MLWLVLFFPLVQATATRINYDIHPFANTRTAFANCPISSQATCLNFYRTCLQTIPATDAATKCSCLVEYYTCMRKAKCTPAILDECVATFRNYNCPNAFVCGVFCRQTVQLDDKVQVIQVHNNGPNHLAIKSCTKPKYQAQLLNELGILHSDRCDAKEFKQCEIWIPPFQKTSVVLNPDIAYLVIQLCLDQTFNSRQVKRCLESKNAFIEVHGNAGKWPELIATEPVEVTYCEHDEDCPDGIACVHPASQPLAYCNLPYKRLPVAGKHMWAYTQLHQKH